MARKKIVSFSNAHTAIDEVEEYYIDSNESLDSFFNISSSPGLTPDKFFGYSKAEINEELKARKETLDRMCSLELLSAIEARLRIDYYLRGQNKLRDELSKAIRVIFDKKKDRASLSDDIMTTWRKQRPEHKTRLDDFGKALDYRHWLAHGRYWHAKKKPHIYRYDYLSIYTLASEILTNMDLIESA